MINIYDIVLNFDKDIIEFYEWEEEVKEKTDKLLTLFSLTFHSFWW